MKLPTIYDPWIHLYCAPKAVEPLLFKALIWQESRFNPAAIGDNGAARGLCQMHEPACQDVGADWAAQLDPETAIRSGAYYFGRQLERFKLPLFALIAWNQGPSVAEGRHLYDARFQAGLRYAAAVLLIQADAA